MFHHPTADRVKKVNKVKKHFLTHRKGSEVKVKKVAPPLGGDFLTF